MGGSASTSPSRTSRPWQKGAAQAGSTGWLDGNNEKTQTPPRSNLGPLRPGRPGALGQRSSGV
eukprot:5925826-Lingulodinium_polyedra.AAC.1